MLTWLIVLPFGFWNRVKLCKCLLSKVTRCSNHQQSCWQGLPGSMVGFFQHSKVYHHVAGKEYPLFYTVLLQLVILQTVQTSIHMVLFSFICCNDFPEFLYWYLSMSILQHTFSPGHSPCSQSCNCSPQVSFWYTSSFCTTAAAGPTLPQKAYQECLIHPAVPVIAHAQGSGGSRSIKLAFTKKNISRDLHVC